MPTIGERVIVVVRGDPVGGTLMSGGVKLSPGTSMRVGRVIVEDLGDQWVVKLDVAFSGKNRMVVPKAALVA
ncbi:MAG: hypothetical protein HY681_12350 [Chloroflexi bacterium]|nr:hypothetical protein [Chloroflexota bacterium]